MGVRIWCPGEAAGGAAEGVPPPTPPWCRALQRLLEGGGQGQRSPGSEDVRGPEHVVSPHAPSRVRPLHFHSEENGTSACHPLPGRRVSLRDRLEGSVALARSRRRTGRAPGGRRLASDGSAISTEISSARRWSGSRSVDADRVHGRLGGAHLLDEGVEAGEADRRTARVTLIRSTRPSGIRVIKRAVAVCAASRAGSLRAWRQRSGPRPAGASARWSA